MSKYFKSKLNFLPFLFLIFIGLELTAQVNPIELTQEERNWISEHPGIDVANELDWPPFDFVEDGNPAGYSIELIQLIAQKTGLNINLVNGYTWNELIEQFKKGEIEILPAVYKDDERENYMEFTSSYFTQPTVLVTNSNNEEINSISNLSNKNIAVIEGFSITTQIENLYPDINRVPVKSVLDGLLKVSTGELDGFIESIGVVSYFKETNFIPNLKIISDVQLDKMDSPPLYISVAKDNIILRDILQKGLKSISKEEMNAIKRKWITIDVKRVENNQTKDLLTSEELQWISNQDPMKIANAMDWPPFNFSDKGTPKGYSIDLIKLVGKKTGLPLEFVDGNTWEEILEKFNLGELDILPSVYYTESRDEFISFTQTYASNPSVLVVSAQNTTIKSLNDLAFKKVAVISNYATAELLKSRHPNIEQVYVKNAIEGLNAVSIGNVDAFIESIGPVSYLIDKNFIPNVKIIGNIDIKRIEETQLHFGVAKDNIMLRDILQKGLDAVTVNELKTIREKWLPVNIASDKERELFKTSDLWKVIIGVFILFIIFYIAFKWFFKRFIKEKVALEFGSRKFRVKTNFYLTILVIMVAGLGWMAIIYIEAEFTQNIKLQLENDLGSANGRLNFWLNERKDYLRSLGHDQKLVDLTNELKEVKNTNKEQYDNIHNNLAQFFAEHNYQGSYIIDEDGVNIGSVDTSYVGDLNIIVKNRSELLDQVFNGEVVFVPPLSFKNDTNENIDKVNSSLMYFLIPIEDTDYNVIAAVIQEIDPAYGFSEILQLSHVGQTGESYVFNQDGRMLSTSRFEKDLKTIGIFQLNTSGRPYIEIRDPGGNLTTGFISKESIDKYPLTVMAKSAIEGNKDVNIEGYNDYRGVPVMGAWMWIDELELGLATEIDVEEALDLFYFIRLSAIIVLGITLIFIIGSILFVLSLGEKANVALIKAKRELEERVEERTEDLSSANQQIQGIVNSLADALIIINEHGIVDFFSPSAEKMFQYKADEIKGLNINILMPSPHKEDHNSYLDNYKNTGVAKIIGQEREVNAIRKDGSVFPTRLMVSEVITEKKRLFVGLMSDLTYKKKAELRLKSQSAALKSAANGVVITNTKGDIVWINPAFSKLTGYSWKEVVGKNPRILNSGKHDKQFFSKIWNTILAGKTWQGEIINKKKNGELFHEEMTITPVLDDKGNINQFVAIKNDITERKKAEEEIRTSENKFRSITSTATDAIVSADKKGVIESWNAAAEKIFGYTEQEAIGQKLEIIIPSKYHNSHQIGMKRVLGGGEKKAIGRVVELEGLHKNGELFPIELALSVFEGKEGMNFSGIIRDITERKKMEAVMIKAKERMEDELNVAKDIQMSMLPLIFPAFPKREEVDIYAELIPAREVGGDFYDFHFIDENHLCFVMADVSGKGVPAALMMAVTKTLLKSRASNDKSTASILTDVNNEIAKDNDTYMFITVFMAILNTNTGELLYSNAGHNPSYIISKEKELTKLGDLHGPVIGAMEGMTYGETKLFLKKNDIVFSYTDGVTESHNIKAELYSDPRLEDLLQNGGYDSSKTLAKLIIESVKEFEGEAEQFDDITVMAIEYCQNPKSVSSINSSIRIKNDLKQITNAIEWFETFALDNEMPFAIIQKINIAFDELLNNIISYGYNDEENHEIDIEIELRSERLIIIISDDGIPFNPFKKDPPDTMLTVEERMIGGLGIHLVKKLMDEYEYKRQTNKNIITLIKHNINT